MTHSEGDASLSRQRRTFTVKASPFNAVKLDVALIVIVGVVLVLVHGRMVQNPLGQLALLAGYGVVSMLWVVTKTRRISRRLAENEVRQQDTQS